MNSIKRFGATLTIAGLLGISSPSFAATGGSFGLGLVLGDPTGFSAQWVLGRTQRVDVALAYAFHSGMAVTLDSIYLLHRLIQSTGRTYTSPVIPYVGFGALLTFGERRHDNTTQQGEVGIRIPLGVEYRMASEPLGFFLELVPGMGLVPATEGFFQAGIGARYYF